MDNTLLTEASKKTRQLRTKFGVHAVFIILYQTPSRALSYTLEKALRWPSGSTDEQPGLIVLQICSSSQLFIAHRKSEASTVHLCAVCLFLWFINKLRSYWVLHQHSWGPYRIQVCLNLLGYQIFHMQSLYFRKNKFQGIHILQLLHETLVLGGGGWWGVSSVAGLYIVWTPHLVMVSLCTDSSNKVWILIK